MVDTCVSGAYGAIRGGSSPPFGISKLKIKLIQGRRTPAKQSLAMVQARVILHFFAPIFSHAEFVSASIPLSV